MAAQPDAPLREETSAGTAGRFDRGTAPAAPGTMPSSGKATAALVVGICSIVFAILFWPVGIILGLVGIGLGATSRGYRNAKAGLICSIVGLALSLVFLAAVGAILSSH